jgi:tetratricopeptide (TPR) repeat protein
LIQALHQAGAWTAGLVCILSLIFSTGCTVWRTGSLSLPENSPEEFLVKQVPFFPQDSYQCGPSSLAMVLAWTGLELVPDDLTADVYTPGLHGALQPSLMSAARQYGRVAYPISGAKELFAEVRAGHPVIILQNLGLSWYPKYHYAVVIGYENSGETIILHSGEKAAARLSTRTFQNTWARADSWGMLVLPAEELPAMVTEERYLDAVVGLERARQFDAAISAYKTALTRWPKSLSAWMGLGNTFYAQGDLPSAASAFQQAAELSPSDGMPMNNLAQVLWAQDKKEQAFQAIRHAIELGGPLLPLFEETLEEFQEGKK